MDDDTDEESREYIFSCASFVCIQEKATPVLALELQLKWPKIHCYSASREMILSFHTLWPALNIGHGL